MSSWESLPMETELEECCVCSSTNRKLYSPEEYDLTMPGVGAVPLLDMLQHLDISKAVRAGRICSQCIHCTQNSYNFSIILGGVRDPDPIEVATCKQGSTEVAACNQDSTEAWASNGGSLHNSFSHNEKSPAKGWEMRNLEFVSCNQSPAAKKAQKTSHGTPKREHRHMSLLSNAVSSLPMGDLLKKTLVPEPAVAQEVIDRHFASLAAPEPEPSRSRDHEVEDCVVPEVVPIASGSGRAATTVVGKRKRRRSEKVLEVLPNDEVVPPTLRQKMKELDSGRRAKSTQKPSRASQRDVSEDEFCDAESSVAPELFDGDHAAKEFEWSPMSTFRGRAEKFQQEHLGPTVQCSRAYEAFRQFWDDDILEHIVRETNRYASELKSSSKRFARVWYDTNVHEIMTLFAFWIMLGIIRMPTIKSCFSNNHILQTRVFRTLMSNARYSFLNRALYLADNSTRTPDSSNLFSLGPLVKHLNRKFQEAYTMDQNITIESLTLCKDSLCFRECIETKAARSDVRTFELCESATGYLWSFIICKGMVNASQSSQIVVRLMRPLLNKGYRLFLDSQFNSPLLARYLKRNKTDCVGTLNVSSNNVPALIQEITTAEHTEGTWIARHSGDVVVIYDKHVLMLSTCHGTEVVRIASKPGTPKQHQSKALADYNVSKEGVKKDLILDPYLLDSKKIRVSKWYIKVFKRLLNVSIYNSFIHAGKSRANEMIHQQAFRLELVDAITRLHLPFVPKQHTVDANRNAELPLERLNLANGHFIVRSAADSTAEGRHYCVWCTVRESRHKETVYICKTCQVPLCLEECFEKFHTFA